MCRSSPDAITGSSDSQRQLLKSQIVVFLILDTFFSGSISSHDRSTNEKTCLSKKITILEDLLLDLWVVRFFYYSAWKCMNKLITGVTTPLVNGVCPYLH